MKGVTSFLYNLIIVISTKFKFFDYTTLETSLIQTATLSENRSKFYLICYFKLKAVRTIIFRGNTPGVLILISSNVHPPSNRIKSF